MPSTITPPESKPSNETPPEAKPLVRSKTTWLGVVLLLAAILELVTDANILGPKFTAAAGSLVILLRMVTNSPIAGILKRPIAPILLALSFLLPSFALASTIECDARTVRECCPTQVTMCDPLKLVEKDCVKAGGRFVHRTKTQCRGVKLLFPKHGHEHLESNGGD